MNQDGIIQQLQPIFADVLDLPDLRITAESNASSVEGWDSLSHINLVVAIEKQYRIRFALGELDALKNVGDMAALISRKVEARGA